MASIVQINGKQLKDINAPRQSNIAPVEASTTASQAYSIGDYFWYNGVLYKATSAITGGGTIAVGTNCEAVVVGNELVKKIPNITYGDPEVVLAETTLNFVKDGDNDWYYAEIEDFNFGENTNQRSIFIVEFDGVEYGDLYWNVLGHTLSNGNVYSSYFIGNGLCIGMKKKNNCPFCIQEYYDGTNSITRITAYNTQASHIVKISVQNVEDIVIVPKESYYEADQINIIKFGSGNSAYGIGMYIADLSGNNAFATGVGTIASGDRSYVEGELSIASGTTSHAEGLKTIASGAASHAEGNTTIASESCTHAEGYHATASGFAAHAENRGQASGQFSHAEGNNTTASEEASHAEGNRTTASGIHSHAEGGTTTASGVQSHAEGFRTTANHWAQHVFGRRNVPDPSITSAEEFGTYVEIVGNGTANDALSNARALDWDGNEYLAGDIYVGCDSISSGGVKLAKVGDIQINGTSIISSGIANIPIASSDVGVVKIDTGKGIGIIDQKIYTNKAVSSEIKTGTHIYKPIVPYNQHESVFYGLAKAAGDSTQTSSSNVVGTYTSGAKTAIKKMLGVEYIPCFVENVSGTEVTITGEPNVRYMCGEVTSISITPPASGTIDVFFSSGTTPAVVTLPNTVKMPAWWSGAETGLTYEIIITDGTYGSVTIWTT